MRASRKLLGLILFLATPLFAQQPNGRNQPHIGYIYPAGAQRGSTCEVAVGGQFLEATNDVLVSGSGIKATLLKVEKPLPQKRLNELRDYLAEAAKKAKESGIMQRNGDRADLIATRLKEAGADNDEIKAFLQVRKQRADYKRQPNLQLAQTAVLKMEVPATAPLGPTEVRLLTPQGLSNPLSFCVGNLPEQSKVASDEKSPGAVMQVNLPAVINGQILPGEVDRITFKTQRGVHLVVAVQARDLIPFLADAVPGWFQPVAVLYGPNGKEVAFSKDFRFSPDPVFCYEVAENGAYRLEIRDALYRGREDFVYRITVGEVPFVTGVFPLGGAVRKPNKVSVAGWNLPMRSGMAPRLGPRSEFVVSPSSEEGIGMIPELSNGRVIAETSFSRDSLPEVREQRVSPKQEQRVTLPVIVNGRIESSGEVDVYSFSCKEGENVVAEVQARRLGSPLDSWLKVTDPDGHKIAFNDDWKELDGGYLTHKADSYLTFTAPASGIYRLHLGDAQYKGGPEFAYRLRISPPRPDFALRITPSSVNGRPGHSVPVILYASRRDGFSGDIVCALKDPPPGFSLDGGWIQAGQDKARATLTFPPDPMEKPVRLAVQGTAKLCQSGSECEITHPGVPAEDMLQAFMYHHLVPASALLASTSGTARRMPPFQSAETTPVKLPIGSLGRVVFFTNPGMQKRASTLRMELNEPIDGITLEGISAVKDGIAVDIRTNAEKVKPGMAGNLILELFNEWMQPAKDGKPAEKKQNLVGYLPAIPFKVVGPE